MELAGTRLDLSKVKVPVYNLATRDDHIAPAKSVYLGEQIFRRTCEIRCLRLRSHRRAWSIPPASKSTNTGPDAKPAGDDVDKWLADAKEHAGSWWPDWMQWLKRHGDAEVEARQPGSGKLKAIEDAPGSYVKVRS